MKPNKKRVHAALYLLIVWVAAANLLCTSGQPLVRPAVQPRHPTPLVSRTVDTLMYSISFEGRREQELFISSFDAFLSRYPFGTIRSDTSAHLIRIVVAAAHERDSVDTPSMGLLPVERAAIIESVIEYALEPVPFRCTVRGGKVILYTGRPFWDEQTSSLVVHRNPFGNPATHPPQDDDFAGLFDDASSAPVVSSPSPFHWEQVSGTRIRIVLRDGNGEEGPVPVTPFDLVQMWSDYIRERPADGMSLFQHVRGIGGFVAGREAALSGIVIVDERTLELRLDRPVPTARTRMNSRWGIPRAAGMGSYRVQKTSAAGRSLLIPASTSSDGCLDSLVLVLKRDRDPFLTYSLGRYDAMMIRTRDDIDYARTRIRDKGELYPLGEDRYFLSLRGDSELRGFCAALVSPRELLTGAARCDGELIGSLSGSAPSGTTPGAPPVAYPSSVERRLTIVFVRDDDVSVAIAERIYAAMAHLGMSAHLNGLDLTGYQQVLVGGEYTVAVGWVDGKAQADSAGALRTADIWFEGELDEERLVHENRLVPLFAARWYLLAAPSVALQGTSLVSLYRNGRP